MSAITTGSMGRPFLTVAEAADELAVTERFHPQAHRRRRATRG